MWAFLTLLCSSCVFSAELQGVGTEASPHVQLLFPGGFVSAVWSWCWAPETGQKVAGLRDQGWLPAGAYPGSVFPSSLSLPSWTQQVAGGTKPPQTGWVCPPSLYPWHSRSSWKFSAFIKFVTSPGSSFLPYWKVFTAFLGMQNLKYQSEFFKYEMKVLILDVGSLLAEDGLSGWQELHFFLCGSFRTGSWRWRNWFYPLTTALSGTAPGLLGCGLGTCWPWRGTGLSTASSLVSKDPADAVQSCSLHSKQPGTNGICRICSCSAALAEQLHPEQAMNSLEWTFLKIHFLNQFIV